LRTHARGVEGVRPVFALASYSLVLLADAVFYTVAHAMGTA